MTLILTHLSRFGIIHASDSNLTDNLGAPAGSAQKTFSVGHLGAGLTVAGSYSIGGVPMNTWMDSFIQEHAVSGVSSLRQFANELRTRIESEMTSTEKSGGSMIHIAGYVEESGRHHPEFYFVRNVHGIDQTTGEYRDLRDDFQVTEDFWTRDCPRLNLMTRLQGGGYFNYVNGFASGRIGYVLLQSHLNEFFRQIWAQSNWQFRPPQSLAETELFVRLYMNIIDTLFQVSDYTAPFVGGPPQIYAIRQPANTVTTP